MWRWVSQGEGDLVITDVVMPDENAFDLVPRIKKMRPDLPVVIMSAQNTFLTAIRASERGAYEYLPKPFDLKELIGIVGRALSQPKERPAAAAKAEEWEGIPLVGRSAAMQEIYRALARRTGVVPSFAVGAAFAIGAWIAVDARWQLNLISNLERTAEKYAGKSIDEKHRVAEDSNIYRIAETIRKGLPAGVTKVTLVSDLADTELFVGKLRYYLFPLWLQAKPDPLDAIVGTPAVSGTDKLDAISGDKSGAGAPIDVKPADANPGAAAPACRGARVVRAPLPGDARRPGVGAADAQRQRRDATHELHRPHSLPNGGR